MKNEVTNVLLVEDNIEKQGMVLKGLAELSQKSEKTYNLKDITNLTRDGFRLTVSSCLRDAIMYIESNTQGNLITILDGTFPVLQDGQTYQKYLDVIFALEDRLGNNFLIPFSADPSLNRDMELYYKEKNKIQEILSLKGSSKEAIVEGIQIYRKLHQ